MNQSRTTEIGSAERVRLRVLLREMRRVLRASGRLPSLDSDDLNLNQAWVAIGSHILHNSKVFNRTQRLRLAREWGAP